MEILDFVSENVNLPALEKQKPHSTGQGGCEALLGYGLMMPLRLNVSFSAYVIQGATGNHGAPSIGVTVLDKAGGARRLIGGE